MHGGRPWVARRGSSLLQTETAPAESAGAVYLPAGRARFLQDVPNVELRESQAVLALLAAISVNRLVRWD